jgi:hypothetical protein
MLGKAWVVKPHRWKAWLGASLGIAMDFERQRGKAQDRKPGGQGGKSKGGQAMRRMGGEASVVKPRGWRGALGVG